jgi:HSP20 family protein
MSAGRKTTAKLAKPETHKTEIVVSHPRYTLGQELDKVFNEYFETINKWAGFPTLGFPWGPVSWEIPFRTPFVDVVDRKDKYIVTAELPGYEKEDVDLRIGPYSMEIKAEKKTRKEEKSKGYTEKKRMQSSFYRLIPFPEETMPSAVKASMKNGVLEVEIGKGAPKPVEGTKKIAIA